jgi:hypothetical protein
MKNRAYWMIAVLFLVAFVTIFGGCGKEEGSTSETKTTETNRPKSFSAISGAVIVGQEGDTVKYQKKCEACGKVDSVTQPWTSSSGGTLSTSFYCPKCKKLQKLAIKCY